MTQQFLKPVWWLAASVRDIARSRPVCSVRGLLLSCRSNAVNCALPRLVDQQAADIATVRVNILYIRRRKRVVSA